MLIAVAIVAYTISILAFARGVISLDSNMLGAVINSIGALVPLGLFVLSGVKLSEASTGGWKGYSWALVGGIAIGVFTLAMTRIFAVGGNVSFVTPLVYGGAVSLATVIGIVVYKERLPALQLSGATVILLGILMIVYSRYQQGVTT